MTTLALDLGRKRTGVAISSGVIAEAYATLQYDENKMDSFLDELKNIIKEQAVGKIVIGLPLGKDEQETGQSKWTRVQAGKIGEAIDIDIVFTEESYSSAQAAGEKGDIDQVSARIILEQYLNEIESKPLQ